MRLAPRDIGVASLLAAAGGQILYLTQPVWFLNQYVLVADDTYYYLQTARNITRLGWATFDGIHATSGVQLLWTVVVSAIAAVVHDRLSLIRAVLVACVGFNVLAGLLLRRFGRVAHSEQLGQTIAVLWSMLMLWSPTMLVGMEYSLHIAIIAATVLVWWQAMIEAPLPMSRIALIGVLVTLNFWARLDSALFSLIILTVVTLRLLWFGAPHLARSVVVLWAIPLAGAALYVVTCYALAGTPVPLSGLVKTFYAAHHFDRYPWWVALAGHMLWWGEIQVQPVISLVAAIFARGAGVVPLVVRVVVGLLAAATLAWGIPRAWRADRATRRLTRFLMWLWILAAFHAAIVVASIGHFSHVTDHYYGWLLIVWCVWTALLVDLGLRMISSDHARRIAVSALIGVVVVVQGAGLTWRLRSPRDDQALRNVRTELVDWIQRYLPPNAPVAAWNAGQFGYFLDRPVVNLDGLVNDRSFLDVLRHGEPIAAYLKREQIPYVVDYNDADLSMPYLASWDTTTFRNQIPWAEADVLLQRDAHDKTIYVLRLK